MNDLSLATQKPTNVRYGVLGFACALSTITYLDRVCFGTVKPFIQSEFDLTKTEVGMLFTAFALAYAAFEVPTGWLGDIFGPRVTLIRIVLWWSAFTALTGMIFPSPQYPVLAFGALLTVRFLFGVGEAGAFPNISCAFARWFPLGERGRAQGAVWMAGRLGGGITPLVVLTLVYTTQHDDVVVKHWRHIFWIFGVLGVLWCVVFWFWFRDRPQEHPSVNAAEVALIHGGAAALARWTSPPPPPVAKGTSTSAPPWTNSSPDLPSLAPPRRRPRRRTPRTRTTAVIRPATSPGAGC